VPPNCCHACWTRSTAGSPANRADLERRGVTVRVDDSPEEGVRWRIRLAAGIRHTELTVRDFGQDSGYRQVDTGPGARGLRQPGPAVHRDTAEFHLNRIARWLRV